MKRDIESKKLNDDSSDNHQRPFNPVTHGPQNVVGYLIFVKDQSVIKREGKSSTPIKLR